MAEDEEDGEAEDEEELMRKPLACVWAGLAPNHLIAPYLRFATTGAVVLL